MDRVLVPVGGGEEIEVVRMVKERIILVVARCVTICSA